MVTLAALRGRMRHGGNYGLIELSLCNHDRSECMDRHAKDVFLGEIKKQAEMSINAMKALANVHKRMRGSEVDWGVREVMHSEHFRTVHSFLTHISNVSRLIWPPAFTGKTKICQCKKLVDGQTCGPCVARARAEFLQEVLGLTNQEHALKNRTLRDHLEHFDERLDNWQQTSVNKNYVQDYIGPKGGIAGFDERDMMRQLDPGTGEFIFRGESYSLLALSEGAQDILQRATAAIKR